MKQTYQNRTNMGRATLAVLDKPENFKAWNNVSAIARDRDKLKDIIRRIDEAGAVQQTATEGVTTDRDQHEDAAIDVILDIAGAVRAWASEKKNNTVHARMDWTRRRLERMPVTELRDTLQSMLNEADKIDIRELEEYGIVPGEIEKARAAFGIYDEAIPRPRTAVNERKTATESIPALLKEMRVVLDRLDGLIRRFRLRSPAFVSDYRNARIVVDAGGRHNGDGGEQGREMPPARPQ